MAVRGLVFLLICVLTTPITSSAEYFGGPENEGFLEFFSEIHKNRHELLDYFSHEYPEVKEFVSKKHHGEAIPQAEFSCDGCEVSLLFV